MYNTPSPSKQSSHSEHHNNELETLVRDRFFQIYETNTNKDIQLAVVMALNQMVENSSASTQGGINSDIKHSADLLSGLVKRDQQLNMGRTLLSVVSLCRLYRRLAQKVNPHLDIAEIKNQIAQNGRNLAKQISNQNLIIRKYSQPHFREGMVSFRHVISLYRKL